MGYNGYERLRTLDNKGIAFVTRQKCNADFRVASRNNVAHLGHITSGQIIEVYKSFTIVYKPLFIYLL